MTQILLVGSELPLLEGLAQTLATQGFTPMVTQSLSEGRELACQHQPLVALVSRILASESSAETLSIPLAPGGALMLYRALGSAAENFPPSVQRAVMAELTLPLERNRLLALVQHIDLRARVTGRSAGGRTPERRMGDA